jgi:hypothetical protein
MHRITVEDCRIVELPKVYRDQGSITPVHAADVGFEIARVYYLYDVPGGETRGGHAHRELQEFVVSVMGSFDVVVDDGTSKRTFHLDRAYYGLYLPPLIWRDLVNFSSGGICLVLASLPYSEPEYVREYSEFLELKGQ